MALEFFELLIKFMIDNFEKIQYEKNGSIGKLFIPLQNLKNKIHFRIWKLIMLFVNLTISLFIVEFAFLFKRQSTELKKSKVKKILKLNYLMHNSNQSKGFLVKIISIIKTVQCYFN